MAGLGLINGSKACDHCQEPMRDRTQGRYRYWICENIGGIYSISIPGTTIYSDEWRAYRGIVRLPGWLLHRRVRHNRHFVDPVTRYHTQNIYRTKKWRIQSFHARKEGNPR